MCKSCVKGGGGRRENGENLKMQYTQCGRSITNLLSNNNDMGF